MTSNGSNASRFEVVFLGTGSPLPNADRCGAGMVAVAGDTHVLMDCGWGSARQLVPAGVRPEAIDVALFTHMHTDHITDVPDFLFLRWTGGATTPLRIFGPAGTRETMEGFLAALRQDIGFRLAHHGSKLHPDGIRIDVTELPDGDDATEFLAIGQTRLDCFAVDHFPVVPALGYRVRHDGRSVVVTGDTAACESLVEASRGADMLISEALNEAMMERLIAVLRSTGRERQAALMDDVPSYHIATTEVARIAAEASVGEVVLTHLLPMVPNDTEREQEFMAGMDKIFAAPIRVARDLQRIPVSKRGE